MGEDPLVSGAAVDATGLGVHQLPNPDENTQTLFLSVSRRNGEFVSTSTVASTGVTLIAEASSMDVCGLSVFIGTC